VIRHGFSQGQGSILGPFLFLLHINDLPKPINGTAEIVLFLDDTTDLNPIQFKIYVNKVFRDINITTTITTIVTTTIFSIYYQFLLLYVDKTQVMQFVTTPSSLLDLNIMHGNKKIVNMCNTKCLGLTLEDTYRYGCTQTKFSLLCD
jgi:hypothetical protein